MAELKHRRRDTHLASGQLLVASANLVWLPIAGKLKVRHGEEVLYCSMAVEGLLAIQEKENPNFIREKLILFLNSHIKQQLKGE